ncbi:MAG: hypothetical protein KJO07_07645 [Deltaproteobacteria bacterium]|nr:hypothetical protein [Deltaproteobacteria bacterium]
MGNKSGLIDFNLVTVFVALVLAGAGYGTWKFAPPYWQAQKVDQVLAKARFDAAKINLYSGDSRAEGIANWVRDEVIKLGVDERFLEVYFNDDFTALHANYKVHVKHLVGGTTTLDFQRSLKVPTAETSY